MTEVFAGHADVQIVHPVGSEVSDGRFLERACQRHLVVDMRITVTDFQFRATSVGLAVL